MLSSATSNKRWSAEGDQHDSNRVDSLGTQVINSDAFKGWNRRGKIAIDIATKTITTATGSGGAFIAPDRRPEVSPLPRRRLTIRDLIPSDTTVSNSVEYPRQLTRTNAAAPVAEGATKPESDYTWELVTSPVRTIAHWVPVSKQAADDLAVLRATIDNELRFGLALEEERQLLDGDNTGQNLAGIMPLADTFEWGAFPVPTAPSRFDFLLAAIAAVRRQLARADRHGP